jgi:hypothetical protein
MFRTRSLAIAASILVAAACGTSDGGPSETEFRIDSIQVVANPHNVLSLVVRFYGAADSARVLYRAAGAATDSATPAFATEGASPAKLYALGLFADTSYVVRVVAYGAGVRDTSEPMAFGTGPLPGDLPTYAASGPNPLPGVTVFAVGNYGVVIDNTGRIVWYRFVPNGGPGLNFMVLQNGNYVGRPLTGVGAVNVFVMYDALGDSTRTLGCRNGLIPRFHDVIVDPDGSYWIMCDDNRTVDMTAHGGLANALVTGTGLQHIDAAGNLTLNWSPFDHFAYTDADTTILKASPINWTHGNGLSVDTDGNILISFRALHEVTKINATTGAVMWRMGGKANQFTFTGLGAPGFRGQHNVRVTGPGEFILLDNQGSAETRFERYAVDPVAHTAEVVQTFTAFPATRTDVGGSVHNPAPGRWLMSVGTTGVVREFTSGGSPTWQIDGNPGYVFRAQKFPSLYRPGIGAPR